MRVSAKLALIDRLSLVLDGRYDVADLETYLRHQGVYLAHGEYKSKAAFVKATLSAIDIPESDILRIADDLEVDRDQDGNVVMLPWNWQDTLGLRLFISHIAKDKDKAMRLRDCLAQYSINGFVAHEDISPTAEWQIEIDKALRTMEVFVAILTPGFQLSAWAQQEVGFAVARRVKIISLKMGEDPAGFIARHQALARRERKAEDIAKDIDGILAADPNTAGRLQEAKDEIPF